MNTILDLLAYIWWTFDPSVNIRIFARTCSREFGNAIFDDMMMGTAFRSCSPRERWFILKKAGLPISAGEIILEKALKTF